MERWSNGVLKKMKGVCKQIYHYSITPLLHYGNALLARIA
jgi:hypothetical protein